MAALAVVPQSDSDLPYVTVTTDARGSTCWLVVGGGMVEICYCGRRAMTILRAMLLSRGITAP
jgi:hypothetical protein